MKSYVITTLLFFTVITSHGQQQPPYGRLLLTDTLELSPLHSWFSIPESNATWAIGIPGKVGMNDSYDGFSAIATKLTENYPLSSSDYFDVHIPYYDYIWGEGVLSFWHKFDTDSLNDGGVIEISIDGGVTWTNIALAKVGISNIYSGLYTESDTIVGKIPAFTGKSNGWQKVELYWFWLGLTKRSDYIHGMMLRFKFLSGDASTPKGGWEISNFVFKGYAITGGVDGNSTDGVTLYPNPTIGNVVLSMANFKSNLTFSMYTQAGVKLFDIPILSEKQEINLEQCHGGSYIYSISQGKRIINTGQLIKE